MRINTTIVGLALAFATPAVFAQNETNDTSVAEAAPEIRKQKESVDVTGKVIVDDKNCLWIVCELNRRYQVLGGAARTLRDAIGRSSGPRGSLRASRSSPLSKARSTSCASCACSPWKWPKTCISCPARPNPS